MTRVSAELLATLDGLLKQALELDQAEREMWLAHLRRDQPDHAAELEALLAEEARLDAAGFLGEDAGVSPVPRVPGLEGRRLGAYTLERPLGQGGMGTVWLARRSDGRYEGQVAVKLLNLALLDPVGSERFRREGTLLARLSHPNIARLLDAGVTEGGQPFLVLEYVEGTRIDHYCDEHRLGPEARLRLFLDVLGAVSHAHANLIVHRDLKPSNILVAQDGTVKLLDFGIGKLLENGTGESAAVTLSDVGGRALTPEYAAPEQVAGGTVTTATDVYALGVLLYLLLAGRHPTGEGSRTAAEHLQGVLQVEAPRLSAAVTGAAARGGTAERLRRLYRGDLDNIVARALKKRPEERYASVGALADDVQRHLSHEPVAARPDSLAYRAGKFVRRNLLAVGLAATGVLTLVGGLVGTIAQAQRADRAARAAEDERDFAFRQLSRAEAVNDLNYFVLSDAAPSGRPFTVGTLMAQAESIVVRSRADSSPDRVELFLALGRQYSLHDEDAKARRLLESGYTLSRGLRDPSIRAKAACALGAPLGRAGELDRAEELVREGLAQLPDDPRFALDQIYCLLRGSEVSRARDEMNLAVSRVEAAERLHRELRFPAPSLGLHVQLSLATVYQFAGRLTDAARAFERADARFAELGRDRTESAGTLYNNWGLMLLIAGRPLAAESLFRRAMAIGRSDSSLETVSPMLLANYARSLNELDRLGEAVRFADAAYARARRAGDEFVLSIALRLRADLYSRSGELDRAERTLAELAPRLRRYPPRHAAIMHLQHTLAQYRLARGDLPAAWATADSAVGLARVLPGANQFLPIMLLCRSEVELAMRRYAEAERDATEAREAARVLVGGEPSSTVGTADLLRAHALRGRGRVREADTAFAVAFEQLRTTLGPDHPRTREAAGLSPR
jgi:eukaryotic-like serine/threonine-protein kinase